MKQSRKNIKGVCKMNSWNVTNDIWTLQNIKDLYYAELALGYVGRGFEEYLKEHFTQTYDINLNFLGWERK